MGRVSVLASRRAEAVSRTTVRIGAALVLSLLAHASANAEGVNNPTCTGRGIACAEQTGSPYIRLVPQPAGDTERGRLAARDRRWVDHCHPVVQYDRYGVARYHYSAAGCEFGIGAE